MLTIHKLLHVTISNWELAERIRRDDDLFDAWEFIANKIGLKCSNTIRKMCLERTDENHTKLGLEEAGIIMDITNDYRLLKFFIAQRKAAALTDNKQMDLFSQPCRTVDEGGTL